jgi:hypothetical protein
MIEMAEVLEVKPEFVCPDCGFKAVNGKGLSGHMRLAHQHPTKQDGFKEYVDEVLEKLEGAWEDQFRVRLEAEAKRNEGQLALNTSTIELCKAFNEDFKIVGKLIESVGNGLIKSDRRAEWCEDDIKGFKALGIEPQSFTLEHVKKK